MTTSPLISPSRIAHQLQQRVVRKRLPTTITLSTLCLLLTCCPLSNSILLLNRTNPYIMTTRSYWNHAGATLLAVILLLAPVTVLGLAVQYSGGAGVGRLVIDENAGAVQCHYDMVLCERIQGKPPTESGLFVPQEDLPKLHLCKVLSLGPGREEENGLIAPMPDIQVGDVVIAKNPWGIGPKDEETADGKKLSYMRAQDIAAVVTGGLIGEQQE